MAEDKDINHPYVPGETPYDTANLVPDAQGSMGAKTIANPGFLGSAISAGGHINDPELTNGGDTMRGGDVRAAGSTDPYYNPNLSQMRGMSKAQMERLGEPGNEFRQMGFSI